MTPFALTSRRVLVTGGTSGIGAAMASAVCQAGGDVVLVGLNDEEVARQSIEQCRRTGQSAELLVADLSRDPGDWIDAMVDEAERRLPGIDTLINNAGVYLDGDYLQTTPEIYRRTMNINVASGFFLTQAMARRWVSRSVAGRVLFTGSVNGLLAEQDHASYDTSKGAVAAMVRSLCVALAPHGIRVNSIAPGLIRTPLTAPAIDADGLGDWMRMHTPNQQIPSAEACGGAAVFLLSDAAEHIHGQTLYVDGGMSAWQQPGPPPTPP